MCGHKTLPSHKLYFNHNHKSYEEYRVKLEKKKRKRISKENKLSSNGKKLAEKH